jgi:DNA-binding transcriptional LysR family regulator
MNFNVLRYVVTVFEEKSMTKAAVKLYVSQSSLSQCIRLLEKDLGASLFERSKTSLKPTRIGEYYAYWAKQTLASEQRMRQHIYELSHTAQRKLIIGISSRKSSHFLRPVMSRFYERAEGCSVSVREHNSRELHSLLQRGILEFLVDYPHPDWIQCQELPILKERMLIAAPASIRFNAVDTNEKYPSISINELTDKPFIFLSGHERFSQFMNNVFSRIGCSPHVVMECVSPEFAHDMVSEQIGITILSEFALQKGRRPEVCYYTLSDYPLIRPTSVTYPKGRILSDDAQLFISILQEECGRLTVQPEEASLH